MISPVTHNAQSHSVVTALTRRDKNVRCPLTAVSSALQQSQLPTSFTSFVFPYSLAVHPDKITIATGQVAGTSPEGKVRSAILNGHQS